MPEKLRLNRKQKQAVEYPGGPLLIIAGAGTGKTTVISERIKELLTKKGHKPHEILALTFTEKAAREMEERVDVALPYGYFGMWISTFHAFCDRLLRLEALHIGLTPNFRLLTEAEAVIFLRRHLFDLDLDYFRPHGNPTKFIQEMLTHFNRIRDEDVTPEQYLAFASQASFKNPEEKQKTQELAHAFRTYEQLKQKAGVMDFADLIANTLKLLRTRQNVLSHYHRQFRHILVDEFQDTNIAQNELALLLAGEEANLTCVCDDDQAIYRWRGAAVSNIIQLRRRFPRAKVISLTQNYRSTQEILNRAYQLIRHNNPDRLEVKEKISKKLLSQRRVKGEPVNWLFARDVESEADLVAAKIKALVKSKHDQWKDIAVLVRANNHAEPFSRAFARQGIPFQFLGPGQLFRQEEIKDLIAYLQLLTDIQDSAATHRLLSMDVFEISARDLAALRSFAHRYNHSLFEACELVTGLSPSQPSAVPLVTISQKGRERLGKIIAMVNRHLKLAAKETAGQILFYFLEDTGLLQKMSQYSSTKDELRATNTAKFFAKLKAFEAENQDASVDATLDWITMKMELGESPLASDTDWSEENKVNILTVHSAKGLEFPVVFMVNLVFDRFPSREQKERIPIPEALIKEILPQGDPHEQEERRLFYVGMTRGEDRLFLTAARYYAEGKREKRISPFVLEALGVDEQTLKTTAQEKKASPDSLLEWRKQETPEATPEKVKLPSLSFTQLNAFQTCPLQYRYRYILKIPVPQSHAQSFGKSIHAALSEFYALHRQGKKLKQAHLLAALDRNWQKEGYAGKTHEQHARRKAEALLKAYFAKAFDPKTTLLAIEEPFKIRISPSFSITGRLDRIDKKEREEIEIIDYKTGKLPDQKEIDKSLQLTIYALAATDPGVYGYKPENVALSFYYLDAQEKRSTTRTADQLKEAKEKLEGLKTKIESSDFKPTPGPWCDFCDFKILCPAWR